jgi:hypothetical protein
VDDYSFCEVARVKCNEWVFTIPKRLRVYFRYDRSLLGKLCRAAYYAVCDVYALEIDGDCGVPAMVGAVQTFGDLIPEYEGGQDNSGTVPDSSRNIKFPIGVIKGGRLHMDASMDAFRSVKPGIYLVKGSSQK